jgi:hypothetical protein
MPCRGVDPYGLRTYVRQLKTGEIRVYTPILFWGKAADKGTAKRVKEEILRYWQPEGKKWEWRCCEVKFVLTAYSDKEEPVGENYMLDVVELRDRTGRVSTDIGVPEDQRVDYDQNHTGIWSKRKGTVDYTLPDPYYAKFGDWEWTPAHEYAHLLGFLHTDTDLTGNKLKILDIDGKVEQNAIDTFMDRVEKKQGEFRRCEEKPSEEKK